MDARQVVIVGASAAGLRCACRLKRLRPDFRVRVVERRLIFSLSACGLPYVLGGDLPAADVLRRTADGSLRDAAYFEAVKGVEILKASARSIDLGLQVLDTDCGPLSYDELVLATGARPRTLPGQPIHPRVLAFHSLDDLAPLQAGLQAGRIRRVLILGSGLLGCELAEAFRALWDAEVCLVEAAGHPLPAVLDAETGGLAARALTENGVELHLSAPVERMTASDDGVEVFAGGERFRGDVAIVAIGLVPEVALAEAAGVRLGRSGAIAVDHRLQTSVPRIWAAGDCVEVEHAVSGRGVYLPLGSLANRQGRTLANALTGLDDRLPPVVGSMAVRLFETHVAAAGLTRTAAPTGARSVWLSARDRPHFWPEARDVFLQLTYDPAGGRILGLQTVGPGEVVRTIDAVAPYLASGATLSNLAHAEHAYAPPYSGAVGLLAEAAAVALNQEAGVQARSPLAELPDALVDVRKPEEQSREPLEGALSIPEVELRARWPEIVRGSLVVCARGARSAEAVVWLRAQGVETAYLGGGLRWRAQLF